MSLEHLTTMWNLQVKITENQERKSTRRKFDSKSQDDNGMLRDSLGEVVIFISLQHCLQARGMRDCNKGIKFKKGAFNCCNERKISSSIQMCGLYSFVNRWLI